MRERFAALTRSAFADRVRFSRKVFRKNPNDATTKYRLFVEKARGRLFDLLSRSEKLRHACAAFRSLRPREFVKGGIANLTQDDLVLVQHGKPESSPFLVVSLDLVTDQRHGQLLPRTDNSGALRMHRPVDQINKFGAGFLRKSIAFLIVLASIDGTVHSSPLPRRPDPFRLLG